MEKHPHNQWQVLSSRKVYDNPWMEVQEDQVLNPAGNQGIYGTVRFKNWALGIIPIDHEGNTWLVGQYRYPLNEYSWEIPMGGGPLLEPPQASAAKELKEETGLVAQKWQLLMKLHTSNSITNETGYVYLARDLEQQAAETEETEVLSIRKLPFKKAVSMALDGEITDAISVAGLLKAHHLLQL